jgi:hypothetical protein
LWRCVATPRTPPSLILEPPPPPSLPAFSPFSSPPPALFPPYPPHFFFTSGASLRQSQIERELMMALGLQILLGNDGETTSNDNATSPREGGTSEVHRPQFSQRAAASAHSQAAPGRSPPPPAARWVLGLSKNAQRRMGSFSNLRQECLGGEELAAVCRHG